MHKITFIILLIVGSITSLSSQCCQDRHSSNVHDGWVSCTTSSNPVSSLGNSHWIRYDFGQIHDLYESTFWNLNNPEEYAWNTRKARIHYSLNGVNWTYWGDLDFPQTTGDPKYEGFQGPNFGGASARYLVITPYQNYGGSCYGFGEMRINTEPTTITSFNVNINPCINDGIIYGIDGGMKRNGQYSGSGVINNYGDKFDFDPDKAGPGAHTITYQYINTNGSLTTRNATINVKNCGEAGCMPCPPCQNISQVTLDGDPILNGIYYNNPEINSSGIVNSAYNIEFRAANTVVLDNNFEVKNNSVFQANIRDCELPDMLQNGDFEVGTVAPWVMELHNDAQAVLSLDNGAAKIVTNNTSGTGWNIQFEQYGMTMYQGQTYTLTFWARAIDNRDIYMTVGRHNAPYNGYAYQPITLTNQWQYFSMQVTPDEDNINSVRVSANLGAAPDGTYWFDNLSLKQQ